MARESIVITGAGILSCIGLGREAYWDALERGTSGIRAITRFDASDLPCQIAGELVGFDATDYMAKGDVRRWYRHVHQAVASSKLAVDDASLDAAGYKPEDVAVGFGTSVGSPNEAYDDQYEAYKTHGYKKINRYGSTAFSAHSAAVNIGIRAGLRGPTITIASGCATGLDALAWGLEQIRRGRAEAALIGATESPIFPMSFASACSLGILSKRNDAPELAMRPFDQSRDGIVLSEGAVALVLEKANRAKARGARILGEVLGYGSAAEARNPLVLEQEGLAMARAMEHALHDAGISAPEVDHIQAHGVSLQMYDRCETAAYKRVFGDLAYRIPISGVKSMVGQSYSAGGLLGLSAALMALERRVVPPTINLDKPDPECDLDYVPHRARVNDVSVTMTAAMSFGGTHTAVLVGRGAAC